MQRFLLLVFLSSSLRVIFLDVGTLPATSSLKNNRQP